MFYFLVTYLYLYIPKQSCETVCNSKGLHCTTVYHGFTDNNVLPLFRSFGVSCKTGKSDNYHFEDNPCYVNGSLWDDYCVGWKNIPLKINCLDKGEFVHRLCPCVNKTP